MRNWINIKILDVETENEKLEFTKLKKMKISTLTNISIFMSVEYILLAVIYLVFIGNYISYLLRSVISEGKIIVLKPCDSHLPYKLIELEIGI